MIKKVFLLLAVLSITVQVQSLMINPNTYTFVPETGKTSVKFLVTNNSPEILPMEFYIVDRKISRLGEPEYGTEPKEEDFMIFPEQMLLGPDEKQSLQIDFVADRQVLKSEEAYTLMAEVLPVPTASDSPDGRSSLNLSVRYASMLYVRPPNAEADLVVEVSKELIEPKEGDSFEALLITVDNQGSAHAKLISPVLQLTSLSQDKETPILLKAEQISLLDQTVVLSGAKREYRIPWPESLPKEEYVAKLNYKKDINLP